MIEEFYNRHKISIGTSMEDYRRRQYNRFVLEKEFEPRIQLSKQRGWVVGFTPKEFQRIENFAKKKSKAKSWESKDKDDNNRIKREMTGACVEFAARKFYGISDDFDDSITLRSADKDFPDLFPYAVCGIKGSTIGNTPLVKKVTKPYTCKLEGFCNNKKFRCADIIGLTDQKQVWLLGIASPDVLGKYIDDNLFLTDSNKDKTGFHGASMLVDMPVDIEELQKITFKMLIAG